MNNDVMDNSVNSTIRNVADETKCHYFVGMTPEAFLEEFLPWNTSTTESYKQTTTAPCRLDALKSVPLDTGEDENAMYERYVRALDNWATDVPSTSTLRFAHFMQPDSLCDNLNVDVSTYWDEHLPLRNTFSRQQTQETFEPNYRHDAFQHELDEGPSFREDLEASDEADEVEAEDDEGDTDVDNSDHEANNSDTTNGQVSRDTVEEDGPTTEAQSPIARILNSRTAGIHTRGQIAAFAGVALSMTFRSHLFSLLFLGQYARLIRWDRRGAVVTHRFDYTTRPDLVFDFYLRYAQLTPLQRGFDSMVKLYKGPLPEAVEAAFNKFPEEAWFGACKFANVKFSKESRSKDEFFTIQVRDDILDLTETFFIPAPRYNEAHMFPFCRGSRRSLACLYEENGNGPTMCFLKDSWQEASLRAAPEADIYRRLARADVPYVASMRLGGDVVGLETETQDWLDKLSHCGCSKTLGKMVCHRIILNTVARDLSTFTWCKVLLSCIADAMEAARHAYKAGILHRDISAGNIMIVKDKKTKKWTGVLIDWDMCLLWREAHDQISTRRTGTWAFLSSVILDAPSSPVAHTLWDDVESAFWVLIYECLLYQKHNLKANSLDREIISIFSSEVVDGRSKRRLLMAGCTYPGGSSNYLATFKVKGVNKLIDQVSKLLLCRYHDEEMSPAIDLNDPDETGFTDLLRKAAIEMAPLSVTPDGLKSPTNDSTPPPDVAKRESASRRADFFEMPWQWGPKCSAKGQKRQKTKITKSLLNYLDGCSITPKKRKHLDVEEEQPHKKKARKQKTASKPEKTSN